MEVLFIDDWLCREKEKKITPSGSIHYIDLALFDPKSLLSEGLISVTPLDGGNIKNR